MIMRTLGSFAAALTLLVAGCGEKDDSTTAGVSTGSTGSAGTGTGTGTDTTGGDPTTATSTPTTTDSGSGSTSGDATTTSATTATSEPPPDPEDVAECLSMIDPGDTCAECACMNCVSQVQACQVDEGCVAIRECAQEAGCTGVACLGPCGPTIDMYGGLAGMSAGLALELSGCVEMACPDVC